MSTLGIRKLESLDYNVALFAFSRFDTIPANDRQTYTHKHVDG